MFKNSRQNRRREPQISEIDSQGWKSLGLAVAKIGLTCVLALGIPYAAWMFYRHLVDTDYFLPRTITVQGNVRVTDEAILDASGLQIDGANLFETDVRTVESSIETLQWVKRAQVKIHLPDEVTITVVEHEPLGIVQSEQLSIVDKEGHFIKTWAVGDDVMAPVVSIVKPLEDSASAVVRAFEIADDVARRGFPHQIDEIHYDDATGYTLYTDATEIRIGYDRFDERIDRLMIVEDVLRAKNVVASYILVDGDNSLDRIVVKPQARVEIKGASEAPAETQAETDKTEETAKELPGVKP